MWRSGYLYAHVLNEFLKEQVQIQSKGGFVAIPARLPGSALGMLTLGTGTVLDPLL